MELRSGTRLGPYEILEPLGAGGMGEVYRARDTRLERDVALKVLPEAFARDPERVGRFRREAQLLASLNHPRIAAIHGLEESGALPVLVLEFVPGETLAQRIARGPLPVDEALELARQTAEGLEAAHERGIIHRDLKPANIKVTPEGQVKVLDFGLARALDPGPVPSDAGDSPTITAVATRAGALLGTAAYMSPEQARGKRADRRADVWAFGCVLYELLTGRRAFSGETVTDLLAAVMTREPDWDLLQARAPLQVYELVRRCLRKDPRERLRDIGDARIEIAEALAEPAALAPVAEAPQARPGVGRRLALAGALLVLLLVAFKILIDGWRGPAPPRITGYTQLTRSQVFFPPFLSPFPYVTDGSRIYFAEWFSGHFALRQVAIAGGETVPFEAPFPENLRTLFWDITPDRSQLLVGVAPHGALEGAPWLLPIVGGSRRRLGEVVGHQSTWSPDGSQILYANGADLYLARSDGTQARKLLSGPGRAYWPRFSLDGSRIRFSAVDPKGGRFDLWEASADGAGLRPLLPAWNDPPNQCCGSWTPDGKYYIFQATREYRTHLWAIREKEGLFGGGRSEPVQLTTGAMDFIRPLVGPDGKKIFAIGWQLRAELARHEESSGEFVPYLSGLSAEWLAFSRDGEWIAYVTYPEADLWRARADGSERVQLTFPPMRAVDPTWSPDRETIAFVGQLPGQHRKIYLIPADGGTPRPITPEDRFEDSPTWSLDGNSLAFSLGGEEGVHIFDLESGKASELASSEGARSPAWSPDGRYLAAHSADHGSLLVLDRAAQRWDVLAEIEVGRQFWSADGKYLYVVSPHRLGPLRSVHRVRVRDGSLERVADLRDVRQPWGIGGLWVGVTADGSPLLLRDLSIHHIYALDWEP